MPFWSAKAGKGSSEGRVCAFLNLTVVSLGRYFSRWPMAFLPNLSSPAQRTIKNLFCAKIEQDVLTTAVAEGPPRNCWFGPITPSVSAGGPSGRRIIRQGIFGAGPQAVYYAGNESGSS